MTPNAECLVRPHGAGELADVRRLLADAGLPASGVDGLGDGLVVAIRAEAVVGCAAMERYGEAGLLRSVAVDPGARGRGIGARLTAYVLAAAARAGVRRVYLLTETAPEFFGRFGFQPIGREEVDPVVRQSAEFTELCPASAQAMVREPQ
jgi:amino-acid N-acetyltransferase